MVLLNLRFIHYALNIDIFIWRCVWPSMAIYRVLV